MVDWLNLLPVESPLYGEFVMLHDIYEECEDRCMLFMTKNNYTCPTGCGECCTRFEPDILPIEAEYAAAYIFITRKMSAGVIFNTDAPDGCPLFDAESPAHCTIYPVRPLVCRLFAFASTTDKNNQGVYAPCAKMIVPVRGVRALSSFDDEDSLPPLMQAFSTRVIALRPVEARQRLPLREAITEAFGKIAYRFGYLRDKTGVE